MNSGLRSATIYLPIVKTEGIYKMKKEDDRDALVAEALALIKEAAPEDIQKALAAALALKIA